MGAEERQQRVEPYNHNPTSVLVDDRCVLGKNRVYIDFMAPSCLSLGVE